MDGQQVFANQLHPILFLRSQSFCHYNQSVNKTAAQLATENTAQAVTATIQLKTSDGVREASYDGARWHCADDFTAQLLNAYTGNWQVRSFYPDRAIGVAVEVAAALPAALEAQFLRADEPDYPANAETVY